MKFLWIQRYPCSAIRCPKYQIWVLANCIFFFFRTQVILKLKVLAVDAVFLKGGLSRRAKKQIHTLQQQNHLWGILHHPDQVCENSQQNPEALLSSLLLIVFFSNEGIFSKDALMITLKNLLPVGNRCYEQQHRTVRNNRVLRDSNAVYHSEDLDNPPSLAFRFSHH